MNSTSSSKRARMSRRAGGVNHLGSVPERLAKRIRVDLRRRQLLLEAAVRTRLAIDWILAMDLGVGPVVSIGSLICICRTTRSHQVTAVKRVDRRLASEAGWYEIALCASFGSIPGGIEYPHGFVLWCKDDEFAQKGACTIGAGFYPADAASKVKAVLGVKGVLSDVDRWSRVDSALLVRVNSDIYMKAEERRKRLEIDHGLVYELFKTDCVDFVVEMATLIPELKLPPDAADVVFPSDLIQRISSIND